MFIHSILPHMERSGFYSSISTEASSAFLIRYCTQLMVQSVDLTLPLTTRDRKLVSVLEDEMRALSLNPRPLNPQSVTVPTLPRAGRRISHLSRARLAGLTSSERDLPKTVVINSLRHLFPSPGYALLTSPCYALLSSPCSALLTSPCCALPPLRSPCFPRRLCLPGAAPARWRRPGVSPSAWRPPPSGTPAVVAPAPSPTPAAAHTWYASRAAPETMEQCKQLTKASIYLNTGTHWHSQ